MNKTISALLVAAALGGLSGSASAVTIRGVPSCGEWVKEHDPIPKLTAASLRQDSWLAGFLSGIAAQSGNDILKGTDNASLFLWMTNYCKANPLSDIDDGVDILYPILLERKQ